MTTDLVRKEENTVKKFFNETFGELEVHEKNGVLYFPAKRVASILGYSNPGDAIRRLCISEAGEDWGGNSAPMTSIRIPDNIGRMRDTNFIDFGNLIKLAMNSKLPNVIEFQNWIL